jgi:hypothetical protein
VKQSQRSDAHSFSLGVGVEAESGEGVGDDMLADIRHSPTHSLTHSVALTLNYQEVCRMQSRAGTKTYVVCDCSSTRSNSEQ